MEALRNYINSLALEDQESYAIRCGTTIGYLRKAISKRHRMDGALVRQLDENSGGVVSRADLRPDIWPELAVRKKNREPSHA